MRWNEPHYLAVEPDAAPFLHPYVGTREYLHRRWNAGYLALQEASPDAR